LNLLGQQQIGSSKPRTLQLPQNPPSFFFLHTSSSETNSGCCRVSDSHLQPSFS
jgi:hypothetical protein